MPRVPKSVAVGRANLEASVSLIPERYRIGVERGTWADAAASDAAEANYAAKIQQAISRKARVAGIRRVGDAEWKKGALSKGVNAIGPGITAALDKWAANFQKPYSAVVAKLATLPPKTTDAMRNIDMRLKPVVQTFQQNRTKGG